MAALTDRSAFLGFSEGINSQKLLYYACTSSPPKICIWILSAWKPYVDMSFEHTLKERLLQRSLPSIFSRLMKYRLFVDSWVSLQMCMRQRSFQRCLDFWRAGLWHNCSQQYSKTASCLSPWRRGLERCCAQHSPLAHCYQDMICVIQAIERIACGSFRKVSAPFPAIWVTDSQVRKPCLELKTNCD